MATQNTILTQSDFEALTTNPYFSNTNNNYYYSTTLGNLPQIIANVEVNLNAMLNGRLYRRYNPSNLKFNGYNGLSPQVEQKTLLQCLTECVEYRLITQQYVNLNNTYCGVVNGTNNYNTANSNVIGLRQDIQAKLSVLGLYANILLGDKKPNSVLMTDTTGGTNVINYNNLQEWMTFIQQTNWTFNGTLTFNGSVDFANETSFFRMLNLDSGWGTPYFTCNTNLEGTSGSNIILYGGTYSTSLNGITYTFPQSMLDLQTHYGLNLPDWSIIGEWLFNQDNNPPQNYTTLQLLGTWEVPAPKCALTVNSSSALKIYYYHIQVLNAYQGSILTNNTIPWLSYTSNGVFWIDIQKCFLYTHNNGVVDPSTWDGIPITTTINTTNTPDLNTSQWTNYQWCMDKCTFTINCIGGISTNNYATRDTRIVNPFPKGAGMEPNVVTVNTGNNTVSWEITMNPTCDTDTKKTGTDTFCSGSFSPWWTYNQNETLTQINTCLDIYFTVILLL